MIPNHCRVRHDPASGTYGDCVRACIASVLDFERPEDVPHFYADNPDPRVALERVHAWLAERGMTVFVINYPGEPLDELLAMMAEINPHGHYLLFGNTGEADHVVVGSGGKIVHNPAWSGCALKGPASNGFWTVWVIARL